jgi:asparagine N-glycosylation enzyme membrane subunit Stt3
VTRPSSRLGLSLVLALVLALSLTPRLARGRQVERPDGSGWITTDADSLYHARRVDRALVEGRVAGTDPHLDHPHGAAIPWPPGFDALAALALAPFAPEGREARRALVEQGVGTLGLVFGVLGSLVAALAGWRLGRGTGALVAGSYHALAQVAVAYAVLGNGDHHSFATFLGAAATLVVSEAARTGALDSPGRAARYGALAGALVGALLGSWVGGMTLLVALEVALGWLVVRQSRAPRAGLGSFGLALHAAAALVLAPAVVASPWNEVQPWVLVNLSWFHLAFLGVGGAVFVPLALRRERPTPRAYPALVAAALGALLALLLATDLPAGAGLREAFDWASGEDRFMAGIRESRSLLDAEEGRTAADELGLGVWLLLPVLLAALWRGLRQGDDALLPWATVGLVATWQATQQARFAEALALPMAVLLGWGVAAALGRLRPGRLPAPAAGALALVLVGLANAGSVATTYGSLAHGRPSALEREGPTRLAVRRLSEWIDRNTEPGSCVLADWSHGHTLEWAADRPTVATNFGSYLGRASFVDPARFFMEESPAAAEQLLEERDARLVLLTSELPDLLNSLVERGAPGRRERYVDDARAGQVRPAWFATMGARLMFEGEVFQSPGAPPLDFLRLVYASPLPDPRRRLRGPQDVSPAAWLWERVPGARVEARGTPGDRLRVELELELPRARRRFTWWGEATVDGSGLASLRVPYATDSPTADLRMRAARWRLGGEQRALVVPEAAVHSGARVPLTP